MTESARKFLDLLQQRRLLPDATIESLRKQVAATATPLTAHHIGKLLQQKGKITAFQARELLAEVEGRRSELEGATPASVPENSAAVATSGASDDELGLAVVEEDVPKTQRREAKRNAAAPSSTPDSPNSTTPAESPKAPRAAKANALGEVAGGLSGGIDDLLSDPALAQQAGAPHDPLGIAKPKRKQGWLASFGLGGGGKRKPQSGGWESPLIIVGGGFLLLLLIVGGTLAFVLLRTSGDELFKAAEADYASGLYGQAIGKYEKFLQGRGSHPQASLARVRIAVAHLRSKAAGDPQLALRDAQQRLPQLAAEPALPEVRPDLASVLPDIAEKFADAASRAPNVEAAAEQIEAYRAAMQLVDDPLYLPTSVKAPLAARLERMRDKISAAQRQVEQRAKLRAAISSIQSATEKRDAAGAYRTRDELLREYPQLRDDEELQAAIVALSATLREQVVVRAESDGDAAVGQTLVEDHPSPIVAEIVPAKTLGDRVPQLAGWKVPLVIDGVLYTLAADDGRLLWRRFVGHGVSHARLTDDTPDADVLVVDSERRELLRLRASDGELVWRIAFNEDPLVGPLHDGEAYISLASGRLLAVALADGKILRHATFPQSLSATAAISKSGQWLAQCGDHSNVYLLERATLRCLAVDYLGQKAGSIHQSPVFAGPALFVPQQIGLNRSQLNTLAAQGKSPTLSAMGKPLVVGDWLAAGLLVAGSRVAAIDRRGAIQVVEVDDDGENVRASTVAEKSGAVENAAIYPLVAEGWLVVGDRRLSGYRLSTARGTLPAQWVSHEGDEIAAPLLATKGHVFYARRISGKSGVVVSVASLVAEDAKALGQPIWQTQLAPEPAGAVRQTPDGSLQAQTAEGESFTWSTTASGSNVAELSPSIEADGDSPRDLPLDGSTNWRNGRLVPNDRGQVEFVLAEPAPNADRPYPFQPPLHPGETIQWLPPAVVDSQSFIAASRAGSVFRVAVSAADAPHLAATQEIQIAGRLAGRPVVMDDQAIFVERADEVDRLLPINLKTFAPGEAASTTGRIVFGPIALGEALIAVVEPGGVVAWNRDAKQLWARDIDGELPAKDPIANGNSLWLATTSGRVWQLSLDDGDVETSLNFGQPLAAGPAIVGQELYVQATDGSVLVARPQP